MDKNIGERCRIARESAQFTQTQAASLLTITPRRLRDYETSVAKESVNVYRAMAYTYEVSLNWLLLGIGSMKIDAPFTSLFLVWEGIPKKTRQSLWDVMLGLSNYQPLDLNFDNDERI